MSIPEKYKNVQAEILLVGSLYAEPDLYVNYGNTIRSKYDFSDEATRFFYNMFEIIYTTFSEDVSENQINLFMTKDTERLKTYNRYNGYKTISEWIELANPEDFIKYFNQVKKYSLLREYARNGFPADRILEHKQFEKMTAKDIYRIVRARADKIHTVISAHEESIDLLQGNENLVNSYLEKPDVGLSFPWKLINTMARGIRPGKLFLCGFLSNAGKTRNLIYLAAYIVIIHGKNFLLMSNEMGENDLKNCLITTVVNNRPFQRLHGVRLKKPEREIVLGLYRKTGTAYEDNVFVERKIDLDTGEFLEDIEEYRNRLYKESEEFRQVLEVTKWMDEKTRGKLFFKDMGSDYSDSAIEFEMRKHKTIYDVKYVGYDTMKAYKDLGDWSVLKKTATRLKELANELDLFIWADMQLTDDTIYTPIEELSSNNISSSKAVKHVADFLILGKLIDPRDYQKYRYIPEKIWGDEKQRDNIKVELDPKKKYFAMKIDKNRAGNKNYIPLIEQNLDINRWKEIGALVKKY